MTATKPLTIPIQLRIEEDLFNHIKRTARLQAASEDRDIDWRDLMRDALVEKFQFHKEATVDSE